MTNNDVLRSLRYMLDVDDERFAAIVALGGAQVSRADVSAFLKQETEPGYRLCTDAITASALDGLVVHLRGPMAPGAPGKPSPPPTTTISNNVVLKKLRVAFALKEDDVIAIMTAAGVPVSRPELSALFRAPGHVNYRACGDQFLRNFLKSLTARVRPKR